MTMLWIIIGLLFGYSVLMTVRSWKQRQIICGTLEVVDDIADTEEPYIFLNLDISPDRLRNGDIVVFDVQKIRPRN